MDHQNVERRSERLAMAYCLALFVIYMAIYFVA
jgi:hypothetical protein